MSADFIKSNTYELFLQEARKELIAFKRDPENDGSTGIEPPLAHSPYIDQMIQLNHYMGTTASTNHPGNPFFQVLGPADRFVGVRYIIGNRTNLVDDRPVVDQESRALL